MMIQFQFCLIYVQRANDFQLLILQIYCSDEKFVLKFISEQVIHERTHVVSVLLLFSLLFLLLCALCTYIDNDHHAKYVQYIENVHGKLLLQAMP